MGFPYISTSINISVSYTRTHNHHRACFKNLARSDSSGVDTTRRLYPSVDGDARDGVGEEGGAACQRHRRSLMFCAACHRGAPFTAGARCNTPTFASALLASQMRSERASATLAQHVLSRLAPAKQLVLQRALIISLVLQSALVLHLNTQKRARVTRCKATRRCN